MLLYDSYRNQVNLGPVVARGGEGVVYQVEGRDGLLGKVYTPAKPDYEAKLAWMLRNPPATPAGGTGHAAIAWPTDLLYDKHGTFLGFVMPQVRSAVPLFDVFNPRRRAQTLPGFTWRYLHRSARNLAAAVSALHARDYVIGDLNESNVLVTSTALVTLIDTDSFQVKEHRASQIVFYPCPVGKPEYTPPELQGKTFNREVRQADQDRFGLGVLIFQLLMEGSHPFRSQWRGEGDPPAIASKIQRGWFPYAATPLGPIAPPTLTPSLDVLHPAVVQLVRRCFDEGHRDPRRRPTGEEWEQGLAEAESVLVTCRNGHIYSGHLKACPRCQAKAASPARVARPAAAAATAARAAQAASPPPKATPAAQKKAAAPPPQPQASRGPGQSPPWGQPTPRNPRRQRSQPAASTWTMPPASPFTGVRRRILLEWGKALFMAWLASQSRSRPMRPAPIGPIPVPTPAPAPRARGGFAATVQKLILVTALTIGVTMALTSGDVMGWLTTRQMAAPAPISASIAHIDARQGWQSAGLSVKAGDRITADVTGSWTAQKGTAMTGTEGSGIPCAQVRPAAQCVEPMPSQPTGSLIARVGDRLVTPAAPGVFIAPIAGPLQLRINDGDAALADNEGELTVRVSVVP